MDAQQDHPEGHRELQNHARAEGISADIEDKTKWSELALDAEYGE